MEWISVDDRMPKAKERVLVFNQYTNQIRFDFCVESDNVDKHWYDHSMRVISHWIPLPEPPKI